MGCEDTQIDCAATDLEYVLKKYTRDTDIGVGGGVRSMKPLRDCLCTKCAAEAGDLCDE